MNKKQKQYAIFGIIILAVALIYFNLNQSLSILSGTGAPEEVNENVDWNGINVNLQTPGWGSYSSSNAVAVCGNTNSGETISNSKQVTGSLKLSSSTGGISGCSGNYIKATMNLPKGTLTGSCKLNVNNGAGWSGGRADCSILVNGVNIFSKTVNLVSGHDGQSDSLSQDINLEIPETSEVIVQISQADSNAGGSASSEITLSFVAGGGGGSVCGDGICDTNENCESDCGIGQCSDTINQCGGPCPPCGNGDSNFGLIIIGGITLGGGYLVYRKLKGGKRK